MERNKRQTLNRREFIKGSVVGLASLPALGYSPLLAGKKRKKAKVALIKTTSREEGVREALKLVDLPKIKGKKVLLKPNFNSAAPRSLNSLIKLVKVSLCVDPGVGSAVLK
ncbi:hypothetical protein GH140_01775, partial [bacterium]|nr:hypothetical protein [bacterium]